MKTTKLIIYFTRTPSGLYTSIYSIYVEQKFANAKKGMQRERIGHTTRTILRALEQDESLARSV